MQRAILLLLSLMSWSLCQADVLKYGQAMGEGKWQVKGNRLSCELRQTIPHFGAVVFMQRNAKNLSFFVQNSHGYQGRGAAFIEAKMPVYKPQKGVKHIVEVDLKSGRTMLQVGAKVSHRILSFLKSGWHARVRYHTRAGDDVFININAEQFSEAYYKLHQCLAKLTTQKYRNIAKTTYYFGKGSFQLTQKEKRRLNKLIDYVKADPEVSVIRIAGYTDEPRALGL